MTTLFDQLAWKQRKLTKRLQQYRRRMEQAREAEPTAWLAAVRRDDAGDPVERDRTPGQPPKGRSSCCG